MLYAFPKVRLNPAFAVAVRDHRTPRSVQAAACGWPQVPHLSSIIHSRRRIPLTPTTRDRLSRLADLIGYQGELFLPEDEQA
jgi:hypothetical protein